MRLNEKIDKAALDRIMPFEQWKQIQADPRAKWKYEREQAEKTRMAKNARLKKKYERMTPEEMDKIWSSPRQDSPARKEMLGQAKIPEDLLAKWARELEPTRDGYIRAEEIIILAGGHDLKKGEYGNKAIALLAKHQDPDIRSAGQSTKAMRKDKRDNIRIRKDRERREAEEMYRAYRDSGMIDDETDARHSPFRESLLRERIDKDALSRIPNFEEWKKQKADSVVEKLKKRYPKGTIAEDTSTRDLLWAEQMTRPRAGKVPHPLLAAIYDASSLDDRKSWTYYLSEIISGVPFYFEARQLTGGPTDSYILTKYFMDGNEGKEVYTQRDYARKWR